MAALTAGAIFIGAVLGRSFKVPVLVAAGALASCLLLLSCQPAVPPAQFFMRLAWLVANIEFGYCSALILAEAGAARGLCKLFARSRRAA